MIINKYSSQRWTFGWILALLLLGFCADATRAGALQGKLPPNHALIQTSLSDFHLAGKSAKDADFRIAPVNGPGFNQALRVETAHRAANEYDIQLNLALPSLALGKGDIIWLSVWAEMLKTGDESGQGVLGLVLEQSKEPFNKLLSQRVSVGPDWRQFAFPARISATYPAGSLHLVFRLGAAAQTLEIADPRLLQFDDPASIQLGDLPQTRITYGGRDADAAWRKAADERIEQIRKSRLTVHVVDAAGKPVPNATIKIEMGQHAFPFGCVYDPREIAGPNSQSPEALAYQQHFAELFNVGVDEYAMKWPDWINPQDRTLAMNALDWMTAHRIRVRGHCLVWPGWSRLPPDLRKLKDDPAALAQKINDHIRNEVSAFRGRVAEWDVVNEPYVNNDLMKILGYGAMADWFKTAHEADPRPRLLLNETSVPTNPPHDVHYDVLFQQVRAIQQAGAPIGGIGMQAHFGASLTSISDLQQIYDRFAAVGLPVEITELDIDVSDEQLQADYLRDFLTFSFSHPNISGIMMWGFVDNHHWRPDAALWHSNWKIKPAGKAWLDLVKNKWWTRATLTTAAAGSASVRGFLGDYTITAQHDGHSQTMTISLPHEGRTVDITLR